MKKIILLIIILLVSGCTINYKVVISETTASEEILILDNEFNSIHIPAYKNEIGSSEGDELIEGIDYYDMFKSNDSFTFKYTFPIKEYYRSNAVNICLKTLSYSKSDDGNHIINTTNYFNCMDYYPNIDNINISLVLSDVYMMVSNNADNVNNNIYTWNINRDNYKDKNLQFIYKIKLDSDKNKEEDEFLETSDDNSIYDYLILAGVLLLFIFIIIGIIKYKSINKFD